MNDRLLAWIRTGFGRLDVPAIGFMAWTLADQSGRMDSRRVLFVCTHNSARSQMAEGLLRHHGGGRFEAFSAGTEATAVRPEAIEVMGELGIDISAQHSKTVDRFLSQRLDWAITVCDRAREACPIFPGAAQTAHWGFDDPAEATGSDRERLAVFRRVRDEIDRRVRRFVADEDVRGGRAETR